VSCLYCGKEIGPFQSLHDSEFCSLEHRRSYAGRPADLSPSLAPPAFHPPAASKLELDRTFETPIPQQVEPAAPPTEAYPVADFVALEYYSQRARGSASTELRSMPPPRLPIQLPAMRLEPFASPLEGLGPPKPVKRPPAKVVSLPAGAKPMAPASSWWRAAKAIAAGFVIGLFVWGGASLLRLSWTFGLAKPGPSGAAVSRNASTPPAPARPGSAAAASGVPAAKGPVAWVRNAVAKRAEVEFSDTFRHGMSAWGERSATWAPGWSKNPDGYVRPGQLALFRPSLAYSNYHMEFFTQIESKSVGWVVRARDRKNYYGMKFKVVEPGLRPIIAMVHFTVLGGKQGREVEIPLSVMVHNNEPYHVAVDVKGKHVVTSIEGQEIDSFTDDALASGGVGFFEDAGAKARLYWMRVTANNDMLGKLCAYMAAALGPAPRAAAFLEPGEVPTGAPGPRKPPAEIALVPALGVWKKP
jgi:hypothetical protein